MEQTRGRDKAKRNIVLFVIGVFLTFIATVLTSVGTATGITWLAFFGFLALVGSVLEIIAIVLLRNVNKKYANALWALIFNFLIVLTIAILTGISVFQEGNESLDNAANWLQLAADLTESLIVVYFVFGTNQLAEENGKGMPILTKGVVYGYMGIFAFALVLKILNFIPAISENTTVTAVFGIIVIVLYVIRTICYVFFLIRSLWRVK